MNTIKVINISGLEMNLLFLQWRDYMSQPFTGTIEQLGERTFMFNNFMNIVMNNPIFYPHVVM